MNDHNNKIIYSLLVMFVTLFFSSVVISQSGNNNMSTASVVEELHKNISTGDHKNDDSQITIPTPTPTLKKLSAPKEPHQLTNYGASITEMLFYLLLVVGLILFLAWLVKKIGYNHASQTQLMKVTACLPLTAKEKLMVVQIGDEQVVIGVAPGFVGHIISLKNPIDNTSITNSDIDNTLSRKDSDTSSFSTMLSKIIKGQVQDDK
jgi:flagellar biosynthetic protein FliO